MSHRIAERLRQLALQCSRLARHSTDQNVAAELEGVGAELAEEASKLDHLIDAIEQT